jgi:hypothetical protein
MICLKIIHDYKIHLTVNEDTLYKADYEMVFGILFRYEYVGR